MSGGAMTFIQGMDGENQHAFLIDSTASWNCFAFAHRACRRA